MTLPLTTRSRPRSRRLSGALGAAVALTALAAAGSGCGMGQCKRSLPRPGEVAPAPAPPPRPARVAPPEAPARIEAVIDGAVAHVTLRFDAAGEGVDTRAYGVKGLSVTGSGQLTQEATVSAGDTARFDVAFTPPAGESLLVVALRGRFGGGERVTTVRSFAVGAAADGAAR